MWPNTWKKRIDVGDHEQMTQLRCRIVYCSVYEMIHTERERVKVTSVLCRRVAELVILRGPAATLSLRAGCHDGLAKA